MPGPSRELQELQGARASGHSIDKRDERPSPRRRRPRRNSASAATTPKTKHAEDAACAVEPPASSPAATPPPAAMPLEPASSQPGGPLPSYRPARPLPHVLLANVSICFEEQLCTQALELLANSLVSGDATATPACVPPPPHLALAATLAVHPLMTTKTNSREKHAASDAALRYLRHVVRTVDVNDGGLTQAFRFVRSHARTDRARVQRASKANSRRPNAAATSDHDEDNPTADIRSKYANEASLWTEAEDFWAVVGWAFNCSVRRKRRWERWKGWLELMLDVLHNDLESSITTADQVADGELDLKETLLVQYLCTIGGGRNDRRRILRAVTADGSAKSMAEFGEVWKKETRPPKKEKDDRPFKRRKLDIDAGEYGDYLDDSDAESEETQQGRSRSATAVSSRSRRSNARSEVQPADDDEDSEDDDADTNTTPTSSSVDAFGGIDSIRLRQRLFALLTRLSCVAPSLLTTTADLFSLFVEFLRPLPVPVFQQFILPLKPYLSQNLQVSLNKYLFEPFLGLSTSEKLLTQGELEERFAPFAATTTVAADNAKVSLLCESLLRALWGTKLLVGDLEKLKLQVAKGIEARDKKIAMDGRKRGGKRAEVDEDARVSLRCSAQRMSVLVEVVAAG